MRPLFPRSFSDVVEVEEPISEDMRDALRARGHNIQPARKPIGGSQAIYIDWETGLLHADQTRAKTVAPWAINPQAVFSMSNIMWI